MMMMMTMTHVIDAPRARNDPTSLMQGEGTNIYLSFVIQIEGLPTPKYQWRRNGIDVPGANLVFYAKNNVTVHDSWTYTCKIYNIAGSIIWEEIVVIIRPNS